MNAGLPGTGIGGLFYIAGALWMPVHRVLNGCMHGGRTWRRISAQIAIASGILLALFATGWLLGLIVTPDLMAELVGGAGSAALYRARSVVRWIAVIGTAGVLLALLLTVEMASVIMRRRTRVDAVRVAASPVVLALHPPLRDVA